MELFREFIDATTDALFQAARVTEENLDELANIANGERASWKGDKGSSVLVLFDTIAGDYVAEVGDYIVSDMAGHYAAFDKELFEGMVKLDEEI